MMRHLTRRLLAILVLAGIFPWPASGAQDSITFQQLSADVNSPEVKVRRTALKTLATLGAEGLEPLSLLVADPERAIRRDAIHAVAAIYVQPPPRTRIGSVEEAFDLAPYRVSPWAVPPVLVTNLVRALGDDWPSERRDAAYTLGIVLTPPLETRVADELTYSLADPASEVRLAATRALGRLGATRAGDLLIGRIVDQALPVRLAAMRAVGDLRAARALVALQEQLDFYRGATAGRAALDALARIAHPSTAGLFEQERFSRDESHRRSAYEGIARLGGIAAGDAVAVEQLMIEARDPHVAAAMAFALAAAGRPFVEKLVGGLAQKHMEDQVLEYLVELGRTQPDVLVPHAQHAEPAVRERLAIAIGLAGGPQAEATVSRLTSDGDPSVRRAAEAAMLRLRGRKTGTTAER